jgi:hypothetical protein
MSHFTMTMVKPPPHSLFSQAIHNDLDACGTAADNGGQRVSRRQRNYCHFTICSTTYVVDASVSSCLEFCLTSMLSIACSMTYCMPTTTCFFGFILLPVIALIWAGLILNTILLVPCIGSLLCHLPCPLSFLMASTTCACGALPVSMV